MFHFLRLFEIKYAILFHKNINYEQLFYIAPTNIIRSLEDFYLISHFEMHAVITAIFDVFVFFACVICSILYTRWSLTRHLKSVTDYNKVGDISKKSWESHLTSLSCIWVSKLSFSVSSSESDIVWHFFGWLWTFDLFLFSIVPLCSPSELFSSSVVSSLYSSISPAYCCIQFCININCAVYLC